MNTAPLWLLLRQSGAVFVILALYRSTPIHHMLQLCANANLSGRGPSILLRKPEQRSFCSAQNHTSFGVKLAYGVIFAGNSPKKKARNFSVYQEVSGFALFKLEIYCSIGFIVGTGQGRLTNGFIFLYKPIHAASFFLLPYVTLRNSPQLTGNLV